MSKCDHQNFKANVKVNRLSEVEGGPITRYVTNIEVHCVDCMTPFEWIGAPYGYSPGQPMVSVDGLELRAPIKPVEL